MFTHAHGTMFTVFGEASLQNVRMLCVLISPALLGYAENLSHL